MGSGYRQRSEVRGSKKIPLVTVVAAVAILLGATLAWPGSPAGAQTPSPTISSVTNMSDTSGPTVIIRGSNFGSNFPSPGQATVSQYLEFTDTNFAGWTAGHTGNWCSVSVLSWTSSEIVVQASGIGNGWCPLIGVSQIKVTVWSTTDPSLSVASDTQVVAPPASVSSLSPSYGPTSGGTLSVNNSVGTVNPQPDGSVVIDGSGFTTSAVDMVLFGTVPASSFSVIGSGEITAVPPTEENASTVPVSVVMGGGSSSTGCLSVNLLCSYAYDYLSNYPLDGSADGPIFDTSYSLSSGDSDDPSDDDSPCSGSASGSVTLNVSASASLSGSGYVSSLSELPFAAALTSNVALTVPSMTATLTFDGNGDFDCVFPVPGLNAAGLAGLNLRVSGSVAGTITVPYSISNMEGTLSGGFVNTTLVGPDASFTCNDDPVSASNISQCAGFTKPSIEFSADVEAGPWVQIGPDDLNVGVGTLVGAGFSYDSGNSSSQWDACISPLHIEAEADLDGLDLSPPPWDVFGAYNIADSGGSAESLCPFGSPQTAGVLPPGPPTSVVASGGDSAATVNWQAPSSDNGGAPTNYIVTPYIGNTEQPPDNIGSTSTSTVVSGLQDSSMYTFTVTAVNAAGDSQPSAPSNVVEPVGNADATSVAYVTDEDGDTVTPVSGGVAGSPIDVGSDPFGVSSVTPNGLDVFVANSGSHSVSVISTATDSVVRTVTLPTDAVPQGVVISPNGVDAYVSDYGTGTIWVINTSTYAVSSVALGALTGPEMLALSPNGQQLYVAEAEANKVAVIDTNNEEVATTIPVAAGPLDLVVNPAGTTAYVTDAGIQGGSCGNTVTPIDLANDTAETPITIGSGPAGIAISPNGASLYIANFGFCGSNPVAGNTVSVIDTSTGMLTATVNSCEGPGNPAVSPDGSTVYVPCFGNGTTPGSTVAVISTSSNTVSDTIDNAGTGPGAVVVMPDQGPIAAVADPDPVAGIPTTFNASESVGTSSPVAEYHWSFGDGTTGTTSSPIVTHVYASAGNYHATVTAVDEDGASTTQVYDGQEAMLNGSSVASAATAVSTLSTMGTVTASLSNPIAGSQSTYTIRAISSTDGALGSGATMTVLAPPGTSLPDAAGDYTLSDSSGLTTSITAATSSPSVGSATPNDSTITLAAGASFPASDALVLTIASVGNPSITAPNAVLQLATSADVQPATSAPYQIGGTPTISSINPTMGTTAGGTSVTIDGNNLAPNAVVKFGSKRATVMSDGDSQIVVTTPANAAGKVSVSVTTAAGKATDKKAFTFRRESPTISSINPTMGTTAGGTSVTIDGNNLAPNVVVKFGSKRATVMSDGDSQIVVTTPANAAGKVSVSVATAAGKATDKDAFTYT